MGKDTNNQQTKKTDFSVSSHQPSLFNLSDISKKKVEVKFTMEETSNDGGLLLLREVEKQIGLINGLANCIQDERHQSYVDHSIVYVKSASDANCSRL
jgi:hypothetical protein